MNAYIITPFTSTTAQEDILSTQTTIRERLREKLGGITDAVLTQKLTNKEVLLDITIFFPSANRVSINNGLWEKAIEDAVWISGNQVNVGTLKVETAVTGTIMIEVK